MLIKSKSLIREVFNNTVNMTYEHAKNDIFDNCYWQWSTGAQKLVIKRVTVLMYYAISNTYQGILKP